jgi:hypothetical protein
LGWIGVACLTLVDSFFAMFAGGEGFSGPRLDLVSLLLHSTQLVVVLCIGLAAVTWPKVGAALLTVPGVFFALEAFGVGKLVGVFLLITAALFYWGSPRPRRLAYWIAGGVPVAVGVLFSVLGWFRLV